MKLPAGVDRPKLGPVATGLGEVFHYLVDRRRGVTGRAADHAGLDDQAAARAVPGVAEVNSWGGQERQIQVVVDPSTLQARGLTLADLPRRWAATT